MCGSCPPLCLNHSTEDGLEITILKAEFVLRSRREYPKKSFSTLQWNNLKEPDQPFILLKHSWVLGSCSAVRLWNTKQNRYPNAAAQWPSHISQPRQYLPMALLKSYTENEWLWAPLKASCLVQADATAFHSSFFSLSSQFWLIEFELVPWAFYSHVLWDYVLMKHSTEMFEGCVLCAWINSSMLGLRTGSSLFLFCFLGSWLTWFPHSMMVSENVHFRQ